MAQYIVYKKGSDKFRKGIRAGYWVIDIVLTTLGFNGIENTDWKCIDKVLIPSGPNGSPSNIVLTVDSTTSNTINWTRGATNEDNQIVYRAVEGGSYSVLAILAPGTITYTDSPTTVGLLYQYYVVAKKGSTYSAPSNIVNNLTGDIKTGLVAQYLFNEGSGSTAKDSAGEGATPVVFHDGTIAGADYVAGKVRTALSFDGTANTDSVKIGDYLDTVFAGANKQFTISALIKSGVNNLTNNVLLAKYSSGAGGQREFIFKISTGSKLSFTWFFHLDGNGYRSTLGSTPLTDTTKWYHVVMSYDGTNATVNDRVTFYVDAVQDSTSIDSTLDGTLLTRTIENGTSVLTIAAFTQADNSTGANFNGLIDRMTIWSRILTYADILKDKSQISLNNNILLGAGSFSASPIYDATQSAGKEYLFAAVSIPGNQFAGQQYIYKSSDGINLTLVKTLQRAGAAWANYYLEGHDMVRRADDKYLLYYVVGHAAQDREIGVWLSDSDDAEGTWTDQGIKITSSSQDAQKYGIGVILIGDLYYGFVCNYNKTTEKVYGIDLYTSRDGLAWTLRKADWITVGSAGSWDDEMIFPSNTLVQEGNEWRIYYTASAENHAHTIPRNSFIGFTTIGYKRIGNVEGNGQVRTKSFTATGPLLVNADMTGGALGVKLLNPADNSVLAGYDYADMDAINGNTYSTEVTWGGHSMPTDQPYKILFNTAIGAKLYSYNATSQEDMFLDTNFIDAITSTQVVNNPVKYVNNPVFGSVTDTWDRDKAWNSVLKIGSIYYMWYGAVSNETPYRLFLCRATSTDGITWIKPDVNLVAYD